MNWFAGWSESSQLLLVLLVIAVLLFASFSWRPWRNLSLKLLRRYFFRERFNYQNILSKYSHALTKPATDLNHFSRLAPYLLVKSLRLSSASFMVLDRENHCYIIRAGEGESHDLQDYTLAEDSPLIKELSARKQQISEPELKRQVKGGRISDEEKARLLAVIEEMHKLKAVLIIPCIAESEYFGSATLLSTLNLGAKLSREAFSAEDLELLNTLADETALGIEYGFIFEELKKNQERVIRSEKLAAIGTTTAGIAHELRNPLTYISTVAHYLPTKWQEPEFRAAVFKTLPAEIQRMQLIVDGLLDYSRTRELSLVPTDVKEAIEKTLALLAYEIKKNKVFVMTEYKHAHLARADQNRLMQVLMNIIVNAVNAMQAKGGDLSIVTADSGSEIKIAIADTGPGIAKDNLKKIFDPFFTTSPQGTGLGLAITKKIVDEHNGSIFVDSYPNEGTTFTIFLPQITA